MDFDVTKIVRCELPLPSGKVDQAVKVDEKTGDVRFTAIAVDKKKTRNRLGIVFDWDSPADVDVSPLQKNGRLYWMHETECAPVGFIEQVSVNQKSVKISGMIPGDAMFDESVQNSPYMDQLRWIREQVRTGMVKAVSIGFYIRQYEDGKDKSGNPSIIAKKIEIIEVSVVTIGAHETALMQGELEAEGKIEWEVMNADDDGVVVAQTGELIRMSFREPCQWVATPIECDDDAGEMLKASAIHNPKKLGSKKGYKLIHHDGEELSDNELKHAMAVILGARGGIQGISDDVKRSAYEHIAKHYEEAGIECPPFGKYSKEELEALHADGRIIIAGYEAKDEDKSSNDSAIIEMFAKMVEQMSKQKETLDQILSAMTERKNIEGESEAEETPQEFNLDLDTLGDVIRQQIRTHLNTDPDVKQLRETRTQIELEKIREKNRRKQNVR